jgi:hypothetical protein
VEKKEKVAISERLLLRQFYPTFVFLPRLPFFYPAFRFFTPPSVFLPLKIIRGPGKTIKGVKTGIYPVLQYAYSRVVELLSTTLVEYSRSMHTLE